MLIAFQQDRFIYDKQIFLLGRLFRAYLMSPYSFHLGRNLGYFQRKLDAVGGLILNGVLPALVILTESFLVLCLLSVLLITNTLLTIVAMGVLGGGLSSYFYYFKDKLKRWGEAYNHHAALFWQQVNQGLGGIKESKLLGKELFFVNRFRIQAREIAACQIKSDLVGKGPRLFIETIVVGLVMLAMTLCLLSGKAPGDIFVTISLFAIVTVRLMPSLTKISTNWGLLKYFKPSFDAVYDDLVLAKGRKPEAGTQQRSNVGF